MNKANNVYVYVNVYIYIYIYIYIYKCLSRLLITVLMLCHCFKIIYELLFVSQQTIYIYILYIYIFLTEGFRAVWATPN